MDSEPDMKQSWSIWDILDDDKESGEAVNKTRVAAEVSISFSKLPAKMSDSPLEWWKVNSSYLPILARLARRLSVCL